MSESTNQLQNKLEWLELKKQFQGSKNQHMRSQFESDPLRFEKFSINFNGILFDYSKNRINEKTIQQLKKLASSCQLNNRIESMFNGDKINVTENRAVLHTALRYRGDAPLMIDGIDVHLEIKSEMKRVKAVAEEIRNEKWLGISGKPITNIVNIGIGGSYLGPQMVTEALRPFAKDNLDVHFISNIDQNEINDLLEKLNPETTLFIICSKTFTTQETMLNAITAKNWFLTELGLETSISKHFLAVSTNSKSAVEFGIEPSNIFKMWNWVGGRYSVWSAIGISVMIAVGSENFDRFLSGAHEADVHFRSQPFERNIPMVMGMLGIWYHNFYDAQATLVLPYSQHLRRFPAFLQQLDMESNGKSICLDNSTAKLNTGPILFGEIGNPGQHSFFQLLHQGKHLVPIDIIAPVSSVSNSTDHQDEMLSNVFAQTEALMRGKTSVEVKAELVKAGYSSEAIENLVPHKTFDGNRPSNTILYNKLDPKTLGSLIAFYEHKIFVQGAIWNINSFDQWGVELGKELASKILSELKCPNEIVDLSNHDSSTRGLIEYYIKNRQN